MLARLGSRSGAYAYEATGKARSVGVRNFTRPTSAKSRQQGWRCLRLARSSFTHVRGYSRARNCSYCLQQPCPISTWRTGVGQDSAKPKELKEGDSGFDELAAKYGVTEARFPLSRLMPETWKRSGRGIVEAVLPWGVSDLTQAS